MIDAARAGRRDLLVIGGEAGAGKTALLAYAQQCADGMLVLRATGVRGDADVPFAGLLELTFPVTELVDELPRPQREALSVALARAAIDRPLDRFAVGAGVLSLLAAAGECTGIVVLIDDLHWLDAASAEAIVFAARRLSNTRAAFLFAARDDEHVPADVSGLPMLVAGRLDRSGTATLAAQVRGMPLSAEQADRIFAITRGNPLAITVLGGREAADVPISTATVSSAIEEEFGARAAALSAEAWTALLVVAADDTVTTGTRDTVLAALGVDGTALEEAERADLLMRSEHRLAFRHPLVRSAIFQRASTGERRRVHAALAAALDSDTDGVRRTLHLAEAADAPDAALADALEQVGDAAFDRHAYAAAAMAFEQAVALTPDHREVDVRLYRAAMSRCLAGDAERARTSLDAALAVCRTARLRTDLIVLQGQLLWRSGDTTAAVDLLVTEARRIASSDVDGAAALLDEVLRAARTTDDFARAVEVVESSAALRAEMPPRVATAFCVAGRPWSDSERLLQAAVRDHPRDSSTALVTAAVLTAWLGAYQEAYALATSALEEARDAAAPLAACDAAMVAMDLAFAMGDWRVAGSHGDEGVSISRHAGQHEMLRLNLWSVAILAAAEGRRADCEAILDELEGPRPVATFGVRDAAACVLGHLRLCHDDPAGAIDAFERGVDLDVEQLGHTPVTPAFDLIEAYVRSGDRRGAERTAERLDAHAHQPWAVAALARSRGLLAGLPEGDAMFSGAVEIGVRLGTPFEEARSRLLYGEWLRRARRRTDARVQLRAGLGTFERLGAKPWAARARRELFATGETHVARTDGDPLESLTAQERRVALLAAAGASNREIAAQLFLSTKTIEAHLHRVYRKLGLERRADLAAALQKATDSEPETVSG